ncbi:MAG: hypothetical protein VYD87_15230 [Pseudomonadota bacterium]|nr:hypothetical protein [Pseudomonadota bacterium]
MITPDLLKELQPFGIVGLALIVLLIVLRQFGFKPISIMKEHGIWVALAVIVAVVAVALAVIFYQPSDKDSAFAPYIDSESTLSALINLNAMDDKRSFSVVALTEEVKRLWIEQSISGSDETSLWREICKRYSCLDCQWSASGDNLELRLRAEGTHYDAEGHLLCKSG